MASKNTKLPLVGQAPSIDLLPPSIRDLHDGRRNRHHLAISTLIVGGVCLGSLLLTNTALVAAVDSLEAEQKATEKILTAQSSYSDIVSITHEAELLSQAYYVASDREVDWANLVKLLLNPMVSGAKITSMDLQSVASSAESTDSPLSGQTLAVQLQVNLGSNNYEDLEYYLLDVRQWPGYSNSEISDMARTPEGYVATINVHLGLDALVEETKHRAVVEGN